MSCCERPRRALGALFLLLLAGCGFRPLYGDTPVFGYDPDLVAIEVRPVPDRIGQILVQSLKSQINPRGIVLPKRYVLTLSTQIARTDLGIRRDNTSTRSELLIDVGLSLSDSTGHTEVFHDTIRTVTAFNLPDDGYAAQIAEQNARQLAAQELGVEIAQRLAVYVRQQREGGGA
jgi:LPS-assembly lipoprotein